jgi:ankyrin repeat protein
MAALSPNDDTSQEAITRLQRVFLLTIRSVIKKPKKLKSNIRRLEIYLKNPFLDVNFEIDGVSPLAKAASESQVLKKLLQHEGTDLNFCNCNGRTGLFFATECRRTDSLRLLIRKGALLDQRDNEGRTSLSLAAELGHLDHLQILVDSNANVELADRQGWTPLFWAVSTQHDETVEYLLSNPNVNSEHQDVKGQTPLLIAAEARNFGILRSLIDAKMERRQIPIIERDLLIWAIFQRDIETAKLLLHADESLANQRVKGRTPLSMATELGDVSMTSLLIDAGADVHALDKTRWPSLSGLLFDSYLPPDNILQQIEQFPAKHHPTKQSPLLLAAKFGRVEILQELLSVNARLDKNKIINKLLGTNAAINSEDDQRWTSLSWAVTSGHQQTAEFLLELPGAFVDHQDGQGRTPFSLAAERGYVEIMILLINNRANPHVPDKEGHTGFWWFLKARHDLSISSPSPVCRPNIGGSVNPFRLLSLIEALPNPNQKDRNGRNWLSWAAEYGDEEVVQYFLQSEGKVEKVDINIRDGTEDTFSRTPLIWALEGENEAVINLLKDDDTSSLHLLIEGRSSVEQGKVLSLVTTLLKAGCKLDQPDQKGRTSLHLACRTGNQKLVSALINAKANLNSEDHTGKTPLQYALEERSKAVVDLLLNAPSTDLKPVSSQEWFNLGDNRPSWVQITRTQRQGFELELINELEYDWLPGPNESRL